MPSDPEDLYTPRPLRIEPIWERQDDEGDEAWAAFVKYRDAGSERSIRSVAQELSKSATLLSRWNSQWSWRKRVVEYERHQDNLKRQAAEKTLKEMAERQAKQAQLMQMALSQPSTAFLKKLQQNPQMLDALTAQELLELIARNAAPFKSAVDIERTARGADAVQEVEVDTGDGRPVITFKVQHFDPSKYPAPPGVDIAALVEAGGELSGQAPGTPQRAGTAPKAPPQNPSTGEKPPAGKPGKTPKKPAKKRARDGGA